MTSDGGVRSNLFVLTLLRVDHTPHSILLAIRIALLLWTEYHDLIGRVQYALMSDQSARRSIFFWPLSLISVNHFMLKPVGRDLSSLVDRSMT